jgi:hypothetical protein
MQKITDRLRDYEQHIKRLEEAYEERLHAVD